MDDKIQEPDSGLDQLQAHHESNEADIDPLDVALLFNRVGSELTKIDKQSIGDSQRRAMQLDQRSVFNGINNTAPPPQAKTTPIKPLPVQANTVSQSPATQPVQPRVEPPQIDSNILKRMESLEKKIKRIEGSNRAYQKMKKIKHGVSYSVSSNSMKGQIKSADVLLEYIMCEISKGVKTITIKADES